MKRLLCMAVGEARGADIVSAGFPTFGTDFRLRSPSLKLVEICGKQKKNLTKECPRLCLGGDVYMSRADCFAKKLLRGRGRFSTLQRRSRRKAVSYCRVWRCWCCESLSSITRGWNGCKLREVSCGLSCVARQNLVWCWRVH